MPGANDIDASDDSFVSSGSDRGDDADIKPIEANADHDASTQEIEAEDELAAARKLLAQLKAEHRRIDQEITALIETGVTDMIKISRMKKIKLSIKDQIAYLENQTTPDIIA